MIVNIGDGAKRIVDVVNKYCGTSFRQYCRAMYINGARGNCLWFPQVSLKPIGVPDDFKRSLSAENWLSEDGQVLYEKARNVSIEKALSNNNSLVRITFANIIPNKGYSFIGIFKYYGKRNGYRVYKRIAGSSRICIDNTLVWRGLED